MKTLKKVLLTLVGILCMLAEILDVLIIPIAFLILGLLQQMPWQYYAIMIGGYFGVIILSELILHLIFKALGKKYSTRFVQKVEKLMARFTKEQNNS